MATKKKIFLISFCILVLISGGGLFAYQKGYLNFLKTGPEKTIGQFQVKNKDLQAEAIPLFEARFNETKEKLLKDPDDFDSWLYLGALKKGVGDYEGARDIWIYAAKIRPKSSSPFANLADLYANFLNEPQKAEEAIKKAIENDPEYSDYYIKLAEIYRYKMPGQEALYEQVMLEAINKFPNDSNLVSNLALYYRQTDQIEKGIQMYKKLLALQPQNEMAKQDLAELEAKKQ